MSVGTHAETAVPGAGGVVLRGSEVLMVRYRSGQWAFPKGHLEEAETPEQAAVREVNEETGVAARVLAALSPTRYTNDRGEAREIAWFLMSADGQKGELEDTFSEGGFYLIDIALACLDFEADRALLAEALKLRATL